MNPMPGRGPSIRFRPSLSALTLAIAACALLPRGASAAAPEAKKPVITGGGACVDEVWEIRAVAADKVGKTASGAQVVVIEPSTERTDEAVGALCPKPVQRTVIQIVPKA